MTVKSVLLIALMGALAPLAVASPCKPSTTTSVTSAEITTSAPDTTYTETTSTTAEAVTTTEAAPASTTTAAADFSCGFEGAANTSPYGFELLVSRDVCQQLCLENGSCKTFLIYQGYCYRYTQTVEQLVIPRSTGAFFYDVRCPALEEISP
jgi:hypothetical protein